MAQQRSTQARSKVYTLKVGTDNQFNDPLGFQGRYVRVDNFSNKYVYLPDLSTYVPPSTVGAVYILTTESARIEFGAPPTITLPAAIAGQIAVVTFFDDTHPFSLLSTASSTIGKGTVRAYGPWVWTAVPQNVVSPGVKLLLADGVTERIIVPNSCWVSRVYSSTSKNIVGGLGGYAIHKNDQLILGNGIQFPNPPVASFARNAIYMSSVGAPNASPSLSYFINYSDLIPFVPVGDISNVLAAGDYINVEGLSDNAFSPFGAGQNMNVYIETTDY